MTPAQPYDPRAPLPGPGLLVLEASAGTGKTYAIAELVGRFIAEGSATISELLIMTFSRSATGELRDRVRRGLRDLAASDGLDPAGRERVRRAVVDFDAASIMTIHEFCIDAFARFGIRADADPGEAIVEDLSEMVANAAGDVFLSRFRDALPLPEPDAKGVERTTELTPTSALGIARALVANPDAELITLPETTLAPEQQRIDFAAGVRTAVSLAKRREGAVSYDDVVTRLREVVQSDPDVRAMLRSRFSVVLVDEFQDTDPSQWAIIHDTFLQPIGPAVVLIGDPKQGIYSFRGADINSYTTARDTPGATLRTLDTSYRSDAPVVHGVLDLLQHLELGHGIEVGPVVAKQSTTRINGRGVDSDGRRVRLRVIRGPQQLPAVLSERLVVADVAAEIRRTLDEGARIDQPTGDPRPVRPGDFAVIVRTNRQAELIRARLFEVGLPAVVNSQVSVFGSEAARAWLALLRAMANTTGVQVRAAALSEFFGVAPAAVADPEDQALERTTERIRNLAMAFDRSGVPAVLAAVSSPDLQHTDGGILARVLRRQDGERFLTDLRHVAALLHEDQRRLGLGLPGLVDWLATRVAAATEETDERSEALTRRLDTDADAVQVVTIHRCKGLQYAITYVPFGYLFAGRPENATVCTTDLGTKPPRRRRVIDVRSYDIPSRIESKWTQTRRLRGTRSAEAAAEDLRMLYVALTRGIHEVVLTWTQHTSTGRSSLHRALSAAYGAPEPSYGCGNPPLAKAAASPHVKVELVDPDSIRTDLALPSVAAGAGQPPALAAAPYERDTIDNTWARSSFSGLTKGAKHAPRTALEAESEDVEGEKTDEPGRPTPFEGAGAESAAGPGYPTPFGDMPAGTSFGTVVHAVLERVDTSAHDIGAELQRRCAEQLRLRPLRGVTAESLAAALGPAMATPLGRLAPDVALAGIAPGDRLAELGFEIPLHQGADTAQTVAAIGELLAADDDGPAWVRGYGTSLASCEFGWKSLRGFLTGEIDAVLRIGRRYIVVDYKTNLLGPRDGTLRDYRPEVLPEAMAQRHYPLQGLLYCVALHRFLTLRLRGYDPAAHLGGILYLFLRGMAGPGTPTDEHGDPCGVFSWRPSPTLISSLSELLGGAR